MYQFLRWKKNRLIITILFIIVFFMFVAHQNNLEIVRQNVLNALKSIAFLFALISALTLSLFNNYVNGLKDKYLTQLKEVRNLLHELYNLCDNSKNKNKKILNEKFTLPLIELPERDWLSFDIPNDIRHKSFSILVDINKDDSLFLPLYMQRIEDEINTLGLMFVKRILIQNYLDIFKNMIFLISTGMVTIALLHILPKNLILNNFLVLWGMVVILWAIMGTMYIGSFLYNNASSEGDEIHPENE